MQTTRFLLAAAGTLLTLVDGSPVTQCSSSTTLSTGSISGYTFEGCFTEAFSKRALTGKTLIDDSITVEKCSSFCATYNFFGLENGRECYCGNTLMAGSVPTRLSECGFPCPGNTGQLCGAVNRLNIYSKTSISASQSASGSNSGVNQGFSATSGSAGGSDSGKGSSSSGSGNSADSSNGNPSTGSSNGNGQGATQQGSGKGNTSPGNGVTTKIPSITPGGPSPVVTSIQSSYPWSNATTKATSSATLPTLSRPGTGVLPSASTVSISNPLNSTAISSAPSTVSTSSSFLTLNSSATTTSSEQTIASTSLYVSPSNSSASTTLSSSSTFTTSSLATQFTDSSTSSVASSSIPTTTLESSISTASLESSTLSTVVSTSSLDETSITSVPAPTTIIYLPTDSSASLDTSTSSSSFEETSITSTPEPTTIISPSTEPTSSIEITSTLTTLVPTPSPTSEPTTISDSTSISSSSSSTVSSAAPTITNLIADGDFEALSESSTIPWTAKYSNSYITYNFETPTTQATSYGARSAAVTITQIIANNVWFNQEITLSANTVYNFSANTRASVISPGCTAYYYIAAADGTATTILTTTTLLTTNWITNTATYTSTAVTDVTINARLICPSLITTASRTYYFDNISLVAATATVIPV